MRKTTRLLRQNSQSLCHNSDPGLSVYEVGVLTTTAVFHGDSGICFLGTPSRYKIEIPVLQKGGRVRKMV
jgi:hypothetical protein